MTISQGGYQFELEEWAGRLRSAESFSDNLGTHGGGTANAPVVAPGIGAGADFIRTNVSPALLGSMRRPLGRSSVITEETQVMDVPSGARVPRTLPSGPGASPGIAVEVSGGGFLTNEIFYRNSLLRTQLGSTLPVIHLHTPTVPPGAADSVRNNLITIIRDILTVSLHQT